MRADSELMVGSHLISLVYVSVAIKINFMF